MNITSRYVQEGALAGMHIMTCEPKAAMADRRGLIANSLVGRVATADGFGIMATVAESQQMSVDYIEWPASGDSPLPEDKGLRRDFLRYGITALGSAVAETLTEQHKTDNVGEAELSLYGFSLGAIRLGSVVEPLSTRVTAFTSFDAAGYGRHATLQNVRRYQKHLQLQGEELTKEMLDQRYAEYQEEYDAFLGSYATRKHPIAFNAASLWEWRGIWESMYGAVIGPVARQMLRQAERNGSFVLKAGFSAHTFALDEVTVNQANKVLDDVSGIFEEEGIGEAVKVGFQQGSWFGTWHEETNSALSIRRLLAAPVSELSPRLQHRYM